MLASMLRNASAASRKLIERNGAQAVKCRAGAQQCVAARRSARDALFDGAQEFVGVQEKTRLLGFQRLAAEVAALVQRRQKRQPDAGGAGGMVDRLPQADSTPEYRRRQRRDANSEIPPPRCSPT